MAYTPTDYHAEAKGISDIYWQELQRAPDEGGWIEWFHHWREDGRSFEWIRAEIRKSFEWHAIHDKPQPVALPRLVPAGSVFKLDTGERFTAIECSDFNLFGRYLTEGEDTCREVLAERRDLGFNMLRVWSEYQGDATFTAEIGRLVPGEWPGYYAALREFFGLCSAYGLYVEFTVFTGTGLAHHWELVGAAAKAASNVILELANEVNAHPSIDPTKYQPIPGVVCSHGSNGSQSIPVRPWWGYEASHWVNISEWHRKTGHNSMEFSAGADQLPASHVPVIANENTRPDQDGNVNHFYDAAAGAALLCAGSCFHSQSGKKSALFGQGTDGIFAEAWVAGAKSVPLEFQAGRYSHVIADEGPADLRAYRMTLPDGRFHLVRIRK